MQTHRNTQIYKTMHKHIQKHTEIKKHMKNIHKQTYIPQHPHANIYIYTQIHEHTNRNILTHAYTTTYKYTTDGYIYKHKYIKNNAPKIHTYIFTHTHTHRNTH